MASSLFAIAGTIGCTGSIMGCEPTPQNIPLRLPHPGCLGPLFFWALPPIFHSVSLRWRESLCGRFGGENNCPIFIAETMPCSIVNAHVNSHYSEKGKVESLRLLLREKCFELLCALPIQRVALCHPFFGIGLRSRRSIESLRRVLRNELET